jgi:hypothetical protein
VQVGAYFMGAWYRFPDPRFSQTGRDFAWQQPVGAVSTALLLAEDGSIVLGVIAVVWGVGGFLCLLGSAMVRLTPLAVGAFELEWGLVHWVSLIGWVAFMLYSEGYKGFHRAFSPRFAARVKHLYHHPEPRHVVLAPLYAMCFYHSTRKRMLVAWLLTAAIVGFVLMARQLVQPWRGIVDAGVVLGLAVGTLSVLFFLWRAFREADYPYSPELPPR